MRISGYRLLVGICCLVFILWRIISPNHGPFPIITLEIVNDYWMMVGLGIALTSLLLLADLISTKGKEDDRNILSTTTDILAFVVVGYIVFFTQGA